MSGRKVCRGEKCVGEKGVWGEKCVGRKVCGEKGVWGERCVGRKVCGEKGSGEKGVWGKKVCRGEKFLGEKGVLAIFFFVSKYILESQTVLYYLDSPSMMERPATVVFLSYFLVCNKHIQPTGC